MFVQYIPNKHAFRIEDGLRALVVSEVRADLMDMHMKKYFDAARHLPEVPVKVTTRKETV